MHNQGISRFHTYGPVVGGVGARAGHNVGKPGHDEGGFSGNWATIRYKSLKVSAVRHSIEFQRAP